LSDEALVSLAISGLAAALSLAVASEDGLAVVADLVGSRNNVLQATPLTISESLAGSLTLAESSFITGVSTVVTVSSCTGIDPCKRKSQG